MSAPLSILIPAHNEADYIGNCLAALLLSEPVAGPVEVIVLANGCSDLTVHLAERTAADFLAKGWAFLVLDLPQGGKLAALNAGEAAARHKAKAYLDADVTVSAALVGQVAAALDRDDPCYVSGTPVVAPAKSRVTQYYARFWQTLPFVTEGVPGFGLFALNAAGRARWDAFPDIIADDTYARLHFAPHERIKVPACYEWPMIEGFEALVRVRRRQNLGVAEVEAHFPQLIANNDPAPLGAPTVWQRFLGDPLGFGTYAAVALATKLPRRGADRWARGR